MPTYDYRCEASGQIVEVKHSISQTITNWGELCETGSFDTQGIPADTPVTKVISTTGGVVKSNTLKNPAAPPCMTGGGCPGGSCGI